MRRFFIETSLESKMSIQGPDAHHISRVLRLELGDNIIVVSPSGDAGIGKITAIALDNVELLLEKRIEEDKEAPINVYLAQGLPKSDKMDYIVQKAVELGIKGIYPMETKHCVVQYDAAKKNSRSINAEAQLRLERTFELDSLPEPTNPKNITDPDKLDAWAKSILNELLKLKDINNRVERLEVDVEQIEANNYDFENRLNSLGGRG